MEPIHVTYTFFKEGGGCECKLAQGSRRGTGLGFWGGTDEATQAAMKRAGLPLMLLDMAPIDVTVHDQRTGETKRYYQEAPDGGDDSNQ